MKVVIITDPEEQESLMPVHEFELINRTLHPTDVSLMLVEDSNDFHLLDKIKEDDVVLIETRRADVIHQVATRGLLHTGESRSAVSFGSDKILLRQAVGDRVKMPALFTLDNIEEGKKYFVKPLILEDSVGIDENSLCSCVDDVRKRVEFIDAHFDKPSIIEEYIDGYDVTVAIIRDGDRFYVKASRIDSLPNGVQFQSERVKNEDLRQFYDMDAVAPDISRAVKQSALETMSRIGANNYAGLDFRVSNDGAPYLIGVNLYPGLKNTGAMYRTVAFDGIEYKDFLSMIISTATKWLV